MADHPIRLRRAWTLRTAEQLGRLDLPARVESLPAGPFRLERSYRMGRLGPGESVELTIRDMPGVTRVLVDQSVHEVGKVLPIAGRLVVEVGPSGQRVGPVGPEGWGDVRLVVRSAGVAGCGMEAIG